MADRELTLKLGTELKAGAADPLRGIGRAASDSTRPVNDLFQKANDSILRMKSGVDLAGEAFGKMLASAGTEFDRLSAKIDRFDKQFRDVAKKVFGGGSVGVDAERLNVKRTAPSFASAMQELPGAMGLPPSLATLGGAFAALTLTVKASDAALRLYKDSFYRGNFSQGQTVDNLVGKVQGYLPETASTLIGSMSRSDVKTAAEWVHPVRGAAMWFARQRGWIPPEKETEEDRKSFDARKEEMQNLLKGNAEKSARERTQTEGFRMGLPVGMEQTELLARGVYGFTTAGQAFQVQQQERAKLSAALANTHRAPLGYQRDALMADVQMRLQSERALREHGAGAQQRLGVLGEKYGQASEVAASAQSGYDAQRHQVATALMLVNRASTKEEEGKARLQLETQYVSLQEKEQRLRDAANQQLASGRDIMDSTLQLQEHKMALLRQEGDAIAAARRQEEASLRTKRESLGLMHPADLRTALGIARKSDAGQQLSYGDIKYMQSHSDIFGQKLQQEGMKRYNASGPMADMMRELQQRTGFGSDVRSRQLENMQVENDVKIQIELGTTDAIVSQIENKLLPMLNGIESRIKAMVSDMLARAANQRFAQFNNMFPNMPS